MAGFAPNQWRARLLEATARKTAITVVPVYLGLATAMPTDPSTATLATLTEVTTAGYARKVVPAFNSASLVAPIQIVEPTAFSFNVLTADMTVPALFGFLTDAATGTAGLLQYVWELSEPLQARSGDAPSVPANLLILE
jgi:hypothetical protein